MEEFALARAAMLTNFILREEALDQSAWHAVASVEPQAEDYMGISKKYTTDFRVWHGVCVG